MAYCGFRILLTGSQGGLKLSLIPIGALLFMLGGQTGILMVYKVDTNGAVGIPVSTYSNTLVPHRYKLMDYKRNALESIDNQ